MSNPKMSLEMRITSLSVVMGWVKGSFHFKKEPLDLQAAAVAA